MLSQIKMKLKADIEINHQMTSLFHGVLMELIPTEYADEMHNSSMHPFSQHIEFSQEGIYWVVNCLNEEARDNIIFKGLMKTSDFFIKNRNARVYISEKEYKEISSKELRDIFYEGSGDRYISLHFITPTAFKQKEQYLFFPDIRCIFQSLMNKYDIADNKEQMFDPETLEELSNNSKITRYDLKSTVFHLEGVKIPSFIGKITIKVNGTQTMANFARMLFEFGTYSGVGIKTSIGMGVYRIIKKEKSDDR